MKSRDNRSQAHEIAASSLPRVLVIDDLFGRVQVDGKNPERVDLCGQFLLEDISGDVLTEHRTQRISKPVAQVVFCRGQKPLAAGVGDIVEDDLAGTVALIHRHWQPSSGVMPLSMVLLDLCFYTGTVTAASETKRGKGMPEGRSGDDQAESYFGLRILEALHDQFPDLPVVILSSMPRERVSQKFSRLGALGFLSRGGSSSPGLLRDYLGRHGLVADGSGTITGNSKAVLLALRAARRIAIGGKNVLIRGETGTGKELLARYLHDQTPGAKDKPLVAVDSGALSPALYASELFGHRKGAFTGSTNNRIGRIVQADGGDLFLDEIGNAPEDVQIGLLRAIEQKEVMPIGAESSLKSDVRFITATNQDIEERALTGCGFRQDLYHRLREGGVIYMPPVRERKGDIPLLVTRFVRDAETSSSHVMRRVVDPQALDVLMEYDWPGNVRELRNCIFKAVNDYPDVEHLVSDHIQLPHRQVRLRSSVAPTDCSPASIPSRRLDENAMRLVKALASLPVDSIDSVLIAGILPHTCLLVANLLKAGLVATRKPSLGYPAGKLLIHPAVKYVAGDPRLTASAAADIIKRVRNLCQDTKALFKVDPVLREAYETAIRLRPSGRHDR